MRICWQLAPAASLTEEQRTPATSYPYCRRKIDHSGDHVANVKGPKGATVRWANTRGDER